jgi:hypothetical protein
MNYILCNNETTQHFEPALHIIRIRVRTNLITSSTEIKNIK